MRLSAYQSAERDHRKSTVGVIQLDRPMPVGGRGLPYHHGCRRFVSGLCMGDGFTGQLLGQMGLISEGQNEIFKVSGLSMVYLEWFWCRRQAWLGVLCSRPSRAQSPKGEERATNSHIIFHKKHTRHHEPTLRGLPSFRVDGQSINIGNICRSMADRVSTYQYGDTTFVIVSTVLRMFCLDLTQYPLHTIFSKLPRSTVKTDDVICLEMLSIVVHQKPTYD